MKAWRILLPLVILSLAGTALAQERSRSLADVTPLRVIVPWTHFGQAAPASLQLKTTPSLAQDPVPPADPPADPPQAQGAQTPAPPSAQIYEADISKKHPHPPEPIKLPPALQPVLPLSELGGREPVLAAPAAPSPAAGETTASSGPAGQIASITAGYQNREAARRAQLDQLAAQAKDPSIEEAVGIERIRLLLAGEEDRATTTQQLSESFATLAGDLDNRAGKLRDLEENRSQTAVTAQAELSHLSDLTPRQETSLHNLAMLPASGQNDQMMRGLDEELGHEQSTRALKKESGLEAASELKALETQAAQLEQVAAEARARSARLADAGRAAQAQESLLRDRLQFAIARQKTHELLSGAAEALNQSVSFAGRGASLGGLPPVTAARPKTPTPGSAMAQLRDCIRKTGNVDACRAKGGQE